MRYGPVGSLVGQSVYQPFQSRCPRWFAWFARSAWSAFRQLQLRNHHHPQSLQKPGVRSIHSALSLAHVSERFPNQPVIACIQCSCSCSCSSEDATEYALAAFLYVQNHLSGVPGVHPLP